MQKSLLQSILMVPTSVVDNFKYLGSTISSNLSLDVEINARIGKAATVMANLNKRVWQNINLTMTEFQTPLCWRRPNAQAYMLYSAKDALDGWDTYAGWERKDSKGLPLRRA